jgi:O-antigen ligase
VLAPWPLVARGWPLAALAALIALTLWTALSISWARLLGEATHDAYRLTLYCAAFLLALIAMRDPRLRRHVPEAALAGVAIVILYALAGRLLPSLIDVSNGVFAGDRLNQPLTYWNALGILSAMGVVLGVAVAGDDERPLAWRAAALGLAVPCGVAQYLTYSRAAWPALAVGLVFVLLVRPRLGTALAAALALVATGLLVAVVQAFPGVLDIARSDAARTRQGAAFGAIVVVTAIAAGLACARLARLPSAARAVWLPRSVVAAIAVLSLLVVFALGAWTASRSEKITGQAAGASRVTTLDTNRGRMWGVAFDAFTEHPLIGVGSASFQVEWVRERNEAARALDAHSLYIETLAELGIVGALLMAGLVAAIAAGIIRAARAAPGDPVIAAAAGAAVAFAVHAGFDWDWEMPAVTVVALVLAAAGMTRPEPRLSP